MTFPTGRWPLAMQCSSIGTKMARGVSVPILMRTWHDPPLSDYLWILFLNSVHIIAYILGFGIVRSNDLTGTHTKYIV